jgi:Fe-S oxidoreductase
MNTAGATREIFWNIAYTWVIYPLFAIALIIAGYGIYRRTRLWRRGHVENRFDKPFERFKQLMIHAIFQSKVASRTFVGLFHRFIFFGFFILTLATIVVLLHYDFNIQLMHGALYLYFQSLIVDIFSGMILVGIIMAAARRWINRPDHLAHSRESSLMLGLLFLIVLSGFLLEGWRIAVTGDPWAMWSPIGYLIAGFSTRLMDIETMRSSHLLMWWMHLLLTLGFMALAPYTKMMHVLTSTLNIYTVNLRPIGGNLKSINFEVAETLGVGNLADFTWKDLLDLDACTGCGRCSEVCPATAVGKQLSPKDLIFSLRELMNTSVAWETDDDSVGVSPADSSTRVSSQMLWECTTCAACVDTCPVFVEQMPKIVDLRRYQVMEKTEFPKTIQEAVLSLENRGHPFRGTKASRTDWIGELEVPLISEKGKCDVLLWVGSSGAFLDRNQKVTQSLAKLLIKADVDFAILGREEKSTGELARRVGNEYLFESMARQNILTLNSIRFNKIVTACPHSYNSFINEYPSLGGHYQVLHHTQYLLQLLNENRFSVSQRLNEKIAFHDPCYLGRHNGIFTAPRQLAQAACVKKITELDQNQRNSFCCGGGGGMNFMEEPPEKRINRQRAQQVRESGADLVVTACPTCLQMLEDGFGALDESGETAVCDIAEILWEAVNHD